MSESDVSKPLMNALKQDSFLPEDYVKSKGERRANMLSLTLFGVMMLAVVGAFFATNRKWMSVRNEQRSINAMYVREAEKIEGLKALEKQRAEMITKAEVTAALVERVPRSVMFAELVRRMPEDLTLTELELKSDEVKVARSSSRSSGVRTLTGSSGSSGSKSKSKSKSKDKNEEAESTVYIPQYNQSLRIVGVGLENNNIADYIENLRACELLESVELKFIKESKIDGVVLRSFELGAQIRKGADARGLVKPVEALEIPDIPTPDRLIPQKPVFLPPSIPGAKAEGGEEIEVEVGGMPSFSMPSLYEAPVFGSSESVWGSPSGLFDLMAAAARTGERVRSEKAAQEAQSPTVEGGDVTPTQEPAPAEPAAEETPAEKPMWFTTPVTDDAGGAQEVDEGSDPVAEEDESNEGQEPAPTDGDEQEDE